MSPEIAVLRVLLRFARSPRRLGPPTLANLVARVGAEPAAVHRALASLARAQLVLRSPEGPRLSLAGLAVAVACGAAEKSAKPRARIVAKPRLTLQSKARARRAA